MNCVEVHRLLVAIARDEDLDETLSKDVLGHTRTCQECAARLAAERELTNCLRVVRTATQEEQAPRHLEAMLLTQFRAQTQADQSCVETVQSDAGLSAGTPSVVLPFSATYMRRRAPLTRAPMLYASLAAMLLVVIGLGVWHAVETRPEIAASSKALTSPDEQSPRFSTPNISEDSFSSPSVDLSAASPKDSDVELASTRKPPSRVSRSASSVCSSCQLNSKASARRATAPLASTTSNNRDELTTDFLPLNGAELLTPIESGQIVRVQLPRSAMTTVGLPVNIERTNEVITADVLLGEDGLARAVRFVQ